MKQLIYSTIFLIFLSCNNEKLKNKNPLNKDVMAAVTQVATIGQLEKIEYHFIKSQESGKSKIELKLYNSHLATDTKKERTIAEKTAKAFLNKFEDSKNYDSVLTRLIVTEKGNFELIRKQTDYNFSTKDF